LIFSSFTSIKNTLTQTSWDTNIDATREITNNIDEYTKDYDLKNVNIAVLASPDPNTYGRRYRDLLHLTGVKILQRSDYYITDNLFVISSSNEDEVRNDPAYELDRFRSGLLVESWNITDSIWNIYLFERSI
jgi:hypothetical protein